MGCMSFLHAEQQVKDCGCYRPVVEYESKSRLQRQIFLHHLLTVHGYRLPAARLHLVQLKPNCEGLED